MRIRGALFFLLVWGLSANGLCQEKWQAYHALHFDIFYRQVPEDFVRAVEQNAEKYFEEINRNLGYSRWMARNHDDRITIYIYKDQDDYINSAQQEKWSAGVAFYQQRLIRTFPTDHGFFDSILPHEMGHIIFREFIGTNTSVPCWIDEGVAMFQERAKRWGANKVVKQAISEGRFIPLLPLSQLRLAENTSRENIDLFYAEAASLVYYLIEELGENRFLQLSRKLRDGKEFISALGESYGRFHTLQGLNNAWMEWVQSQ
jgi:hypothetical protein